LRHITLRGEQQIRQTLVAASSENYQQAKILMYFVFALYERKNEIQNEDKVPRSELLTKTVNIKAR
jgi:hypothetical protein